MAGSGPFSSGSSGRGLLSAAEKERIANWQEEVLDRSLSNRLLAPIFGAAASYVPHYVAPNVLTLSGTIAVVQAWYVCQMFGNSRGTGAVSIFAIVVYWLCHGIDGKHAVNTMNNTPVGQLFKYVCDSIATTFIPMLVCTLFGAGDDLRLHWYVVQMTQLVMLIKYYSAFRRRTYLRYGRFLGPGEAISCVLIVLILRTCFGLHEVAQFYLRAYGFVRDYVVLLGFGHWAGAENPLSGFRETAKEAYWLLFLFVLGFVWLYKPRANEAVESEEGKASSPESSAEGTKEKESENAAGSTSLLRKRLPKPPAQLGRAADAVWDLLPSPAQSASLTKAADALSQAVFSKQHLRTRRSLLTCLVARAMPFVIRTVANHEVTVEDVVLDGIFLGVLTIDLVIARMAGRELHWLVVAMCLLTALPGVQLLLLLFSMGYYVANVTELCWYMNIPLLSPLRNVYCDGVYDLCHVGHKNLFRAALKHGNRLYVGVCGDKDCAEYKRPPIMTCKERCDEVASCKAVTKVIPNAPTFGISEDFIRKHRIHIVCHGQEYVERYPDPKDDPYYRVPRELGIARALPRTDGLSTSALIHRVKLAQPADEKNTPVEPKDSQKAS